MDKKQVHCPYCGAQLEASQLFELQCSYCGGKIRNPLNQVETEKVIITKIIPFSVTEKAVKKSLFNSFFFDSSVPTDIFDMLEIKSIKQYYVPMRLFSGHYNADWTCTVVYWHSDKNGNSYKENRPANGTATGYFSKLTLANDAKKLPSGIKTFLNVIDLTDNLKSQIKTIEPKYLDGENGCKVEVIPSNMPIESCWNNKVLEQAIRDEAYKAAERQTSSWSREDFSVSCRWGYNYTNLILVPIWYVQYSYNEQEFFFVMNGYDDRFYHSHPRDNTSQSRTWGTILRFFLLLLILFVLGWKISENLWWIRYPMVVGIIFFAYRSFREYENSVTEMRLEKEIGKAKFCNESVPDVSFDYVKYKRNNKIIMCVLIAVFAIWSSFAFFINQERKDEIIQNLIDNMVSVEGGTFTMGATSEQGSDADSDEKPAHEVTLSSFSIGKYEVTQEEWEAVMGSNPSFYKGAKLPVKNVSWDDCQDFIRKLNELTGKQFRLPTEAEWEYAARGGIKSKGYENSGSNDIDAVAWYESNSNSKTHEVGTKAPNELGLYDMSGNVFEWCQDWYDNNYYGSSPSQNPKGPSSGSFRVGRGGGWGNNAGRCRVSYRGYDYPSSASGSYGLRLAL